MAIHKFKNSVIHVLHSVKTVIKGSKLINLIEEARLHANRLEAIEEESNRSD